MNGRNECHLCNATHYVAYIKTWIEDAILVLDQLCFAFYVQVEMQAQNRILHHEMSLSAIYNATSTSCILGVATGGTIACCVIVKLINDLIFLQKIKGTASYLMAPVVADLGCRRTFRARSLSPCVIPRSFSA